MQREILDSIDGLPSLSTRNLSQWKENHSHWLNTKSDDIATLDHSLKKYVSRWGTLARSLATENVQAQTSINATETRTQALRDEIRAMSDLLRRKDIEFSETQNDYEKHIKILESALAQTQPKSNATATLQVSRILFFSTMTQEISSLPFNMVNKPISKKNKNKQKLHDIMLYFVWV